MHSEIENRRPIKARSRRWAQQTALFLAQHNISPNQISVVSIVFAALGAFLLWREINWLSLVGCALCIQARLICNLLDGMVAIEGAKKSALGQLYNEFPDRIADSLLIIALGYGAQFPVWGWAGALVAALTAYVRVFGGALGLPQSFRGPMAKQHRMAVMTIGCIFAVPEYLITKTRYSIQVALFVIVVGAVLTCITRTNDIARQLSPRE